MNEGKKSPTHPFFILIGCIMLILSVAKQTLAQDVKSNDQEPAADYPFIWSSPDSPYLTELRTRYRLAEKVAGCENDYEKAKVIVSWVNSLWAHHGINTPQKSDPISILEEVEAGKRFRCVEYAIVVAGALNALGIPSRTLGLKTKDVESTFIGAGHVVAETYLKDQGKWIMIDGQWGVIPTLNGTPLNAVELQQALADRVMGLDVYSDSGVEKEQYFHWIEDYLYYLDVPFDNRTGIAPEDYAGGILMLVPEKAIRPEKFQVLWRIGNVIYTYSVQDFYPKLTPEIYEDVEGKKAEIRRLFESKSVSGETDLMIAEIVVEGLERTKAEIVRRQLPFKVGDRWTEGKQELAEQRLANLAIFNPITLKVRAEKSKEGSARVFVSTEDVHPLMVYPVEFYGVGNIAKVAIFKGLDLLDQEFDFRMINPFGNGWSISFGADWSWDPWWKVGVAYAGTKGKVYSWEYRNLPRRYGQYNQTLYQTEGFQVRFALDYIPVADWEWILALNYQKNGLSVGQSRKEQAYLLAETEVKWRKDQELGLRFGYGKSLNITEPDFQQIEFSWTKMLGPNNSKLVSKLSGGLSSEETPLIYQFKSGGKRGITLRGHQDNLAGNRYLSGNTEFHKLFFDLWGSGFLEWWGIAFLDYARILPVGSGFGDVPWEVDGGVGVACAVPFGLLKLEVGWDNFNAKPNYHITYQDNF